MATLPPRPEYLGWRLMGAFLVFAAVMLTVAALSLAFPAGPLAFFWSGQSGKEIQLDGLGAPLIAGFLVLAGVFAAAAFGWFQRLRWAWILAVTLISFNVAGDMAQLLSGNIFDGLTGMVLGGALLVFMCRPAMRARFSRGGAAE